VRRCPPGFAKLEPSTNPDTISNAGGQFASQLGASPGVLAVFNTDFTNGPFGVLGGEPAGRSSSTPRASGS
jgi:hypothetical protein